MKKVDRWIVIVTALIIIIGLSYGLMKYLISLKEEPRSRPQMEAKRYLKCDTVVYAKVYSPVEVFGRLQSQSETDIISEASGKILPGEIPLRKGSKFNKGDLLFTIYPDEVRLALYSRKSQFKSSLANLLPDLSFDFPEYESQLKEYFNQVKVEQDLPPFPEIDDDKLQIFLSGRYIISEYYGIKKDELQLKRHSKYAPYNGTYKEVYLEEGSYANTGGKVAHAIRTDNLEVEVHVERFHDEWIKIGDVVEVKSDKLNRSYEGEVIRKADFVDENTQSRFVYVGISNGTTENFLKGEYVHVTFPGQPIESAMEIPRNAVFNTNEVFVVKDDRLVKKTINIIKVNTTTLIFDGLEEGEIIVIQPLINVPEGTRVQIIGAPESKEQGSGKTDKMQGEGTKKGSGEKSKKG